MYFRVTWEELCDPGDHDQSYVQAHTKKEAGRKIRDDYFLAEILDVVRVNKKEFEANK